MVEVGHVVLLYVEQVSLKISAVPEHIRSIRSNDLDRNLVASRVGSSHGRGWLHFVWRTLAVPPHAVGNWFSSIRDFIADSECTLAIVNT
jgi:hypothetical protein